MKLRIARKVSVTRTQRRGTIVRALAHLPYGEHIAVNRWWRWWRVRGALDRLPNNEPKTRPWAFQGHSWGCCEVVCRRAA